MNRRHFLQSGLAAAGVAAFGPQAAQAANAVFHLGVASGDPQPHGIVLWTKIQPDALPSPNNLEVAYEISASPFFPAAATLSGSIQALADNDFTVKIALDDPLLQPFTHHFYRFTIQGVRSPVGRCKTLPLPGQFVPSLRIGFLSCQDFTNGYYTAIGKLIQENVDFIVHLGDYIYETTGSPEFQVNQVRPIGELPSGGTVADTLADYRFLHTTYRSDPALQALHGLVPFIHVWDDHEFQNDSWRDAHADNTATPGVPRPTLRKSASRAWAEYTPANTPYDPADGPLDSIKIYRRFDFGNLARLVMTDERLYRDGPPCGFQTADRMVTTGCEAHRAPGRTMLGAEQRDWFLGEMTDSPAIWNLWGNEMMAMSFKVGYNDPPLYLSLDHWDGYPAERAALMDALVPVQNVVAMTGDIHSFAAGFLKPDFLSASAPRAGVEFVGGSISSSNFADILGLPGGATSASAPAPRETLESAFPGGLIELLVRLNNPHIRFFNSDTHGYGVLDINALRLRCDLKKVSTIQSPIATGGTLASFVVPRNSTQLYEL